MMKVKLPSKTGIIDIIKVYTVTDFPYEKALSDLTIVGRRQKYYECINTFDIEVTSIHDGDTHYGIIYHLQACINGYVVFMRTIDEFQELLTNIKKELEINDSVHMVFYVHFLSYEFQHIRNFFQWAQVFAREKRSPLYAVMGGEFEGIELRCSYYLTNMSLEKFCAESKSCTHLKVKGIEGFPDYDYEKIRYPWTKLEWWEESYCACDVLGLWEALHDKFLDDTMATIPYTSTGYVRRDMREKMRENYKNKLIFQDLALNPELYKMCKSAFRGGNVHANYFQTGEILRNVHSYDIVSSYPYAMLAYPYPGEPFTKCNPKNLRVYLKKDIALLCLIEFTDINADTKHYPFPYIPLAKCGKLECGLFDNGRVLHADFLSICCTDIDVAIIMETYKFKSYRVCKLYGAKYRMLPKELRETVLEYFVNKSTLKGKDDYLYMKSKNMLNSCYGMMVTDIARKETIYDADGWHVEGDVGFPETAMSDKLSEYYHKYNSFLTYQWGVWVTAYARLRLHEACREVGRDAIYIDTDSVKFIGEYDGVFQEINRNVLNRIDNLDVKPVSGKNIMGIWDNEGIYSTFRTWGAKKYVYEKDGKVTVTVAGLAKKSASDYIQKIGIERFAPGLVFNEKISGRTTAWYDDRTSAENLTIDGHQYRLGSSVAIGQTTYILGITGTYRQLLDSRNPEKIF